MSNLIDDILADSFSTPEKAREFFESWRRAHKHDYDDIVREMGFWSEAFRLAIENRRLKRKNKELKKINKSLRKENEKLSAEDVNQEGVKYYRLLIPSDAPLKEEFAIENLVQINKIPKQSFSPLAREFDTTCLNDRYFVLSERLRETCAYILEEKDIEIYFSVFENDYTMAVAYEYKAPLGQDGQQAE